MPVCPRLPLAALCAALCAAACATAKPTILPLADRGDTINQVRQILTERGFSCSPEDEESLVCEADSTYKIIIDYRVTPRRLLFYAIFNNDKACEDQLRRLNDFNTRYMVQLGCFGDSLRFFTSTLVPESELDGRELDTFLVFWTDEIYEAATESGFFGDVNKKTGELGSAPSGLGIEGSLVKSGDAATSAPGGTSSPTGDADTQPETQEGATP